ncbi:MAG: hypothetical protein D6739_11280, partial [Nitrospirae bacterium]
MPPSPVILYAPPRRGRRRVVLFLAVFATVAAAGLVWDYRRPPLYEAAARLLVEQEGEAEPPSPEAQQQHLLTQCQLLTSRSLLERIRPALVDLGLAHGDPVAAAQSRLAAAPVADTHVVRLTARGRDPYLLARLLGAVVEAYQERVAEEAKAAAAETESDLAGQVAALEARVAKARAELAAFGGRHAIVSLEREESQAASRLKGLQEALNKATEALATAEGRKAAVEGAIARGEPVVRTEDRRAIAALKKRAAELEERWAELEQRYPPKRLAIEPQARLLKRKLEAIRGELQRELRESQQAALADATQEVEAARASVARLRREVAEQERKTRAFSARFQEYQAKAADLERLETLLHDAREAQARLATGVERPHTRVELLEAAVPPTRPVAPPYRRDAALALAAALGVAVAGVWLRDFLTR